MKIPPPLPVPGVRATHRPASQKRGGTSRKAGWWEQGVRPRADAFGRKRLGHTCRLPGHWGAWWNIVPNPEVLTPRHHLEAMQHESRTGAIRNASAWQWSYFHPHFWSWTGQIALTYRYLSPERIRFRRWLPRCRPRPRPQAAAKLQGRRDTRGAATLLGVTHHPFGHNARRRACRYSSRSRRPMAIHNMLMPSSGSSSTGPSGRPPVGGGKSPERK